MAKLLTDIGNTAIKFAVLDDNEKIVPIFTMSSRQLISEKKFRQEVIRNLEENYFNINDITMMCLSSVRPMWDDLFHDLASDLSIPFYQVKKNLNIDKLKIDIPNPRNVGADLIAGAYGAVKIYPNQNVVLINMGTATTVSLIKTGVLEGTIIMPGLETVAEALFERAQLLEKFDYEYEPSLIGKNTKQAINIGLVNGHLFAINAFVEKIKVEVPDAKIILTGGNAKYILDLVTYQWEDSLIFIGLVAILHDNDLD